MRQIDFVEGGFWLCDLRQIDCQTRCRHIFIYDKLIAQDIEVAYFVGPHLRQIDSRKVETQATMYDRLISMIAAGLFLYTTD